MALNKNQIAKRIAQELQNGFYVNLGIGIPTLVANFVPVGIQLEFQSENGILGVGPFPDAGEEDPDIINASKETITTLGSSSFFDAATSFGMIRGKHIDLTVLGAMQVDQQGNIANWKIPGKLVKGMGGAMDLVAGVGRVVVIMDHANKRGESKLLKECTLPLTGKGVVDRIITNLGVFDVVSGGLKLIELADGVTRADVDAVTEARLVN